MRDRDADRAGRGVLRRRDRRHPFAAARHRLGVSRLSPRDQPFDRAANELDISLGPISIEAGSLLLPIAIIGIVYVPYVARPIRGEVLTLRNREFIEAAVGLGASTWRLLWSDVLPNILTTVIVCFPIVMAIAMLTEAALSFLSIGVQPPEASWGTIILYGQGLRHPPRGRHRPGNRDRADGAVAERAGRWHWDALDPRAKIRRHRVG